MQSTTAARRGLRSRSAALRWRRQPRTATVGFSASTHTGGAALLHSGRTLLSRAALPAAMDTVSNVLRFFGHSEYFGGRGRGGAQQRWRPLPAAHFAKGGRLWHPQAVGLAGAGPPARAPWWPSTSPRRPHRRGRTACAHPPSHHHAPIPRPGLGLPSNYSFVKRLGKGTQGDVWLAVDSNSNQLVAVKVGAGDRTGTCAAWLGFSRPASLRCPGGIPRRALTGQARRRRCAAWLQSECGLHGRHHAPTPDP